MRLPPRRAATIALVASFAAVLPVPNRAPAQTLDTLRIASALEWPLFVTWAPGEPYHIYIVLKRGSIRRLDLRTNAMTEFINLDPVVVNPTSVSDERGLLGLTFDPNFQSNGRFYVNYYSNAGQTVIARYTASGGVGNPASAVILLTISQPFTNHNGGWLAFGPDGYLYDSQGDGGSANDPSQNAQNVNILHGKMLRLDVNGTDGSTGNYGIPPTNPFAGGGGSREIWAYGLRNAWRCSFDRATGALYIADVGQGAWEEINFQAAGIAGGQNYGWDCYEGNALVDTSGRCNPLPSPVVFPFHVYDHGLGISITGGYVYRGCAIPAVYGRYFFADYGTARVWTFSGTSASAPPNTATLVERTADLSPPIGGGSIASLASFGEDAFGELYLVRHSTASGEVFRIVPQGNAITDCNGNNVSDCGEIALGLVPDCNTNGAIDSCEIASNPALDCNTNGVIDTCEIASNPALDCDGNSAIDSCEIAANPFLDCNNTSRLDACEMCMGDANYDRLVNFGDVNAWLVAWGANYLPCLVGSGDANHDGVVNFADGTAILSRFGTVCP